MGRNSFEFKVDDVSYITSHYPTPLANKLFLKITKIIVQPLGILFAKKSEDLVDANMIGEAIKTVSDQLDPETINDFFKEILVGCQLKTDKHIRDIVYDTDFMGKTDQLYEVIGMILKFQFEKVFQKVVVKVRQFTPTQTP